MRMGIIRLFNKLRFRQKLILSYLIVIIIPILVLGIYSYTQSKRLLDTMVKKEIERNINTVTENVNYKIEFYNNLINLIIANRTLQEMLYLPKGDSFDLSRLSNQMKDFLDPYFSMMLMLDQKIDKLTIYSESGIPEFGDFIRSADPVSNEFWYKNAVRKFGTRWYTDQSHNGLVIVSKFPETFKSGHHVLYIRVDTVKFFDDISKIMQEYGVMFRDSEGDLIYSNSKAEAINSENKEMDTRVYTREFANTKWTLDFLVPIHQESADAAPILYAAFIVIGICIAILLVIISLFANGMIRRIYRLNHWMKKVEDGELELKIQTESKDEIGELTNRFGNMLLRINDLIQEVRHKELKALQAQMNPHFLYNTLSSVNWKALKMKSYEISRIVISLSKYYRTALNKGDNHISVLNELENVRSYLDIMLLTNDNSFDVVYDIQEEVYQFDMINMILQPIVENAIQHGVNRKQQGRGVIRIVACLGEGTIEFTITDNGPGMDENVITKLLTLQSNGYGLRNVKERIALYFGTKYGLFITSEPGEGTTMKIIIPKYNKN